MKTVKKEQILAAGLEVMHRQGYNGTGVKDIVDAAGIPKGSFYTYFESKEAFALEALDTFAERTLAAVTAECLTDSSLSPRERIRRLFDQMVERFRSDGCFNCGCFIGNLSQEMADTSDSIREKAEELFSRSKGALQQCIQKAQQAGEISSTQDSACLAEFIWNSWQGAVLDMKASRSIRPLESFQQMVFTKLLV